MGGHLDREAAAAGLPITAVMADRRRASVRESIRPIAQGGAEGPGSDIARRISAFSGCRPWKVDLTRRSTGVRCRPSPHA
jgi:hypothetical protein